MIGEEERRRNRKEEGIEKGGEEMSREGREGRREIDR